MSPALSRAGAGVGARPCGSRHRRPRLPRPDMAVVTFRCTSVPSARRTCSAGSSQRAAKPGDADTTSRSRGALAVKPRAITPNPSDSEAASAAPWGVRRTRRCRRSNGNAQHGLQLAHMVADRRRCQPNLRRALTEAGMAGRRLEGAQRDRERAAGLHMSFIHLKARLFVCRAPRQTPVMRDTRRRTMTPTDPSQPCFFARRTAAGPPLRPPAAFAGLQEVWSRPFSPRPQSTRHRPASAPLRCGPISCARHRPRPCCAPRSRRFRQAGAWRC